MADARAILRWGLHAEVATGAIALTERRERLDAEGPGRRWPVKAVSRRSRARAARALTGLWRSGMGSPSGSVAGVDQDGKRKAPPSARAHVVGWLEAICQHALTRCWRFQQMHQSFQQGRRHRAVKIAEPLSGFRHEVHRLLILLRF